MKLLTCKKPDKLALVVLSNPVDSGALDLELCLEPHLGNHVLRDLTDVVSEGLHLDHWLK